jgi:hypothetical protein
MILLPPFAGKKMLHPSVPGDVSTRTRHSDRCRQHVEGKKQFDMGELGRRLEAKPIVIR